MVVVVWVGVAWSRASSRCEKNGELRHTIRGACAWRSCELWMHPCQLLAAHCVEFSLT